MTPSPAHEAAIGGAEPSGLSIPAGGHLERGFRFEQSGLPERALQAYREALDCAATTTERAEATLRIARALRTLARWDEAVSESRAAVAQALEASASDLAAEAMNVEIGVHSLRGALDDAESLAARALMLSRTPRVRGIALQNLGTVAAKRGDFETADRRFGQSVVAFREAEYELGIAVALTNGSAAARDAGDAQRALDLGREAAALCRRLNALDILL